jgi:hypothetical protein
MPTKERLNWLRQRLGRQPTEEEITPAMRYDDMMRMEEAFADEIEEMRRAERRTEEVTHLRSRRKQTHDD